MTAILSSFKLVSAKRQSQTDSVHARRLKLCRKLDEQIALLKALQKGETLQIKRVRKERDELSGVLRTIETNKRIKQFWYTSESGKLCAELRYGQSVIEFKKGINAIEIADESQLLPVFEALKKAVEAGELDPQITMASEIVKARFHR